MKTPEEIGKRIDAEQALHDKAFADAPDRAVAMMLNPGRVAAATHAGLEFLRQSIAATEASGARDEAVRGLVEMLKDAATLLVVGAERMSEPVTTPGPRPAAGNRAQRRSRR
jgi:hypothetical protein